MMTTSRIAARLATASQELPEAAYAGAALRGFFQIAERWGLNTAQQRVLLGNPPASTYFKWKKARDGALPRDALERISYLLGIYKALQILLPDPQRADLWVSEPNTAPLFGGRSALQRMLGGNVSDLFVVRQYLDAQRG
jgi:hypothetical protein